MSFLVKEFIALEYHNNKPVKVIAIRQTDKQTQKEENSNNPNKLMDLM